jgi:branched-subunit amino acid transport protein AzlD
MVVVSSCSEIESALWVDASKASDRVGGLFILRFVTVPVVVEMNIGWNPCTPIAVLGLPFRKNETPTSSNHADFLIVIVCCILTVMTAIYPFWVCSCLPHRSFIIDYRSSCSSSSAVGVITVRILVSLTHSSQQLEIVASPHCLNFARLGWRSTVQTLRSSIFLDPIDPRARSDVKPFETSLSLFFSRRQSTMVSSTQTCFTNYCTRTHNYIHRHTRL